MTRSIPNDSGEPGDCYEVEYVSIGNFNCGQSRRYQWYLCEDSSGWYKPSGILERPMEERLTSGKVEKLIVESVTKPSYVQEVIYNGRIDDNLKFIYREYSGDMIRPAFTQDVQYDLSSSDIIGFKSLRLRILSATNTNIRYELISNF